jgi:hydrogenase maturation protease
MGPPVLVLGFGNVLLQDDGVGVHAARALIANPPAGCTPVEVGISLLGVVDLIEEAGAVVALDAVAAGQPPGTVVRFELGRERRPLITPALHDVGLTGVLRLIPPEARPQIVVLGIEPAAIGVGVELSPQVAAALPKLLDAARNEVARLASRLPFAEF